MNITETAEAYCLATGPMALDVLREVLVDGRVEEFRAEVISFMHRAIEPAPGDNLAKGLHDLLAPFLTMLVEQGHLLYEIQEELDRFTRSEIDSDLTHLLATTVYGR